MGNRAESHGAGRGLWILRPVLELTFLVLLATLAGALLLDWQRDFGIPWIDEAARSTVSLHIHPGLNQLMTNITSLGAEIPLLLTFCALAVWCYRKHEASWARFFTLVMIGALTLDNIVKPLVGRPRPVFDQLVRGRGESWPSGHTIATTALLFALAYYLSHRKPVAANAVWAAALSGSILMGISRVYLGVHWPTDVIAGVALGAAWTSMCARSQGVSVSASATHLLLKAGADSSLLS